MLWGVRAWLLLSDPGRALPTRAVGCVGCRENAGLSGRLRFLLLFFLFFFRY